jgi:hypothetical protein
MALICSFDRFSLSDLRSFSSCMNFSHREIKSRSDSFVLGFGTGIKKTPRILTTCYNLHSERLEFVTDMLQSQEFITLPTRPICLGSNFCSRFKRLILRIQAFGGFAPAELRAQRFSITKTDSSNVKSKKREVEF